jgi:phage regulator Rha-like protein
MERVAPPPPPRSEAASKEVAEMSGIERSELLKNIGNQKLKHGLYKEVSPSSR